jgi:hypothetical protein
VSDNVEKRFETDIHTYYLTFFIKRERVPDPVMKHQVGTDRIRMCNSKFPTEAVLSSYIRILQRAALFTRV